MPMTVFMKKAKRAKTARIGSTTTKPAMMVVLRNSISLFMSCSFSGPFVKETSSLPWPPGLRTLSSAAPILSI